MRKIISGELCWPGKFLAQTKLADKGLQYTFTADPGVTAHSSAYRKKPEYKFNIKLQ
jgi:hypothetical protein